MGYRICWNDRLYPQIYIDENIQEPEYRTLAEAKREIVEHSKYDIQHWRDLIRNTQALRKDDISIERA